MMGSTHGISGSLAGLIPLAVWQQAAALDPALAIWWVAGCTAGALLPDADHEHSSTSKLWGLVTQVPARALGRLAGGHRAGTHDVSRGAPILFALVLGVGLALPTVVSLAGHPPYWVAVAAELAGMTVVALLAGLTLLAVGPLAVYGAWWVGHLLLGSKCRMRRRWNGRGPANFVLAWMVAVWLAQRTPGGFDPAGIGLAAAGVAVGVSVAIAQDGCTRSGIPWRGRNVHLVPFGWRLVTNSPAETWFVRAPVLVGVAGLLVLIGVQA